MNPFASGGEPPFYVVGRCSFDLASVRTELKALKHSPENRPDMSQATKVVLGTIGVAVVVGLLLLGAIIVM